MRPSTRESWAAWLLVVGCVVVFAAHAYHYRHFFTDDAYISLRYSERLLHGQGLTWTDGETVEGYSNLLWVLGCALIGAFGIDLPIAARVLGAAGALSTLLAAAYLFRPSRVKSRLPALGAMLAMATASPLPIWTVGGLEQPMMAGLLAWGAALTIQVLESGGRDLRWAVPAGVLYGLLCLTRPDAPLLAACACGVVVLHHGVRQGRWRSGAAMAVVVAVFVVGQLLFRLSYYDDWLPNTAYAKVAFSDQRLRDGVEYVGKSVVVLGGVLLPAVLAWVVALNRRLPSARAAALLVPMLAWLSYLVVIGGDFFVGRRQMVPVVVLGALAAGQLWTALVGAETRRRRRMAWWVAAMSMGWLAWGQTPREAQNQRAMDYRWPRHGAAVGELISVAFGDAQPLLAVEAAGSLPFHAGTPALDMLGLNDRMLAHARPATIGQGVLGHELGDGLYVLSRQPDLVVFCNARGTHDPCYRGARELASSAGFRRNYKLVHVRTPRPEPTLARLWIRMDSPKVGVRTEGQSVYLPAQLFAHSTAPATLDRDQTLVVRVRQGHAVAFGGLKLDPGLWELAVEADGRPSVRIASGAGRRDLILRDGERLTVLVGSDAGSLRVRLTAESGSVLLRRVVLRRASTRRAAAPHSRLGSQDVLLSAVGDTHQG